MIVELLVNLKLSDGRMIAAGSVFSDKDAPIPDFVMRRLTRRQAKILEQNKFEAPKKEETKVVLPSKAKAVEVKVPKTEKKKIIMR